MRSLQIVSSTSRDNENAGTLQSNAQQISIDSDTGTVYVASGEKVTAVDILGQFSGQTDLKTAGYLPEDGLVAVVGLQYLPDQTSACIATATGDIILWYIDTDELESVATVDVGISAMAWSPDQELVVFATGQNSLIMMTREFDIVMEVPIHSDEFGEAKFINVGWGKKETQFHGSEGKQAAVRKQEDVKPAFAWDDQHVRVSWRGDGQFVVVSAVNPLSGARDLRFYTRELVLHSSSEKADGLEQCLGWKPSGSVVVSSQRKPNKHDIVFFEMNGLLHGGFTLPFKVKEVKVCEVLWNSDSCVLAVWCEQLPEGQEDFHPKSYVQLWTVNNYHWYLKQSLEFGGTAEERVAAVMWDPEHAYSIHIVCAGGRYMHYTLAWTTLHSQGFTAEDLANVAVIDGDKLLVTPFRTMVVPPPMAAYHLQLPCPATFVTFDPTPGSNAMAVLLNDGHVSVYRFEQEKAGSDGSVKIAAAGGGSFNTMCKMPALYGIYSLPMEPAPPHPLSIHHLTWIARDKFLYCIQQHSASTTVFSVELSDQEFKILGKNMVPAGVTAIAVNPETGHVVIQLTDRTLMKYDVTHDVLLPFCDVNGDVVELPLSCTQMALCQLGGKEVVLGLTDRFRFYVNSMEIANNCTSFSIHDEFLLLTTHTHTCRCINRNTQVKDLLSLSDGKAHPFDESVRRVERGSRAVHVVAGDTRLVLQMPRGNLETVHPRALVLAAVRKQLDRLQFGEAFNLMRKHRINMNLLHDHSPLAFLKHVDTFIRQIDNVNHINLFLTDLQEEDVTVTMYTAAYAREVPPVSIASMPGKVDSVCEAVRKALLTRNPDKYLLSVLTTYVRKTTPQLDVALNTIKDLKASGGDAALSRAEEAMKYLLLLVDVNELYDHALGTYDFDLVLMVAERSQKDPKEYIPFLNDLRRLETHYQHYTIDLHLKRHCAALTSIAKCGDEHFDECLKLVGDQRLYAEALRLYPVGSQHYKDLSVAYGLYLAGRRENGEAGLVYARAGLWKSSFSAYQEAGNWRQALVAVAHLGLSADAVAKFAADMACTLAADRRPIEAACLLEQYAGDVEEAIMTLIRGAAWDEALRLMYKHARTDFIESDFEPALEEAHLTQTAVVDQMRADFEHHKNRLVAVRQEKERVRLELLEGGGDFNQADADLFSDTSSATGLSTASSQYSSMSRGTMSSRNTTSSRHLGKSQRKASRKLWSLKQGSRHEDLALTEALSQLCHQAEELKGDINSLLRALVQFHREDVALTLQTKLTDFLSLIEKAIPVIWDPDNDASETLTLGPDATTNQIIAAMQQGQGRQKPEVQLDPSLRVPPPMSKDKKWQLHSLTTNSS